MSPYFIGLCVIVCLFFYVFFGLIPTFFQWVFASKLKRMEWKIERIVASYQYKNGKYDIHEIRDMVIDFIYHNNGDHKKFQYLLLLARIPLDHDKNGKLIHYIEWNDELYNRMEKLDDMLTKREKYSGIYKHH